MERLNRRDCGGIETPDAGVEDVTQVSETLPDAGPRLEPSFRDLLCHSFAVGLPLIRSGWVLQLRASRIKHPARAPHCSGSTGAFMRGQRCAVCMARSSGKGAPGWAGVEAESCQIQMRCLGF